MQCNLCQVKLAYHTSTTTMHSHLRAKHPKEGPSTDQQSMASFVIKRSKFDVRRAEQTTVLISKMIAKDTLPIRFVEGEGFRSLIEFVEPQFTVPLRKNITEKYDDDNANELRTRLASVAKLSLTTDSWTALTNESYLTVTCHYILNWEIQCCSADQHASRV